MKLKKKKGVALLTVMIAIAVLMILGTSFLSVSVFQSKQVKINDNGIKAHYLARAGAEAALKAWQEAPSTAKPSGSFDTVYLNSVDEFVNASADSKGKFDVNISMNGTSTVIVSTGTVDTVHKSVTATISPVISVIPGPMPINGSTTGFYEYNSGQINPGNWPSSGSTTGIVRNEAKNGKGLKIVNKNAGPSFLTYEKMLFSSQVQVVHEKIELKANIVVFMNPLDFSLNGNSKGNITLKVYGILNGATPITRTIGVVTSNWGVVIIDGVGYYYKDLPGGITIRSDADIASNLAAGNMELITDPDKLKEYLESVLSGTLTVTSYSILWS